MLLEWLLSPITDKNTLTGAVINGIADAQSAEKERERRYQRESIRLQRRQAEALEELINERDRSNVKITSIVDHVITTDEGAFNQYKRYSSELWYLLPRGNEPLAMIDNCKGLEQCYQQYKKDNY